MDKPVAWIKARELTYMKAVVEHGATEWKTNLGLKPEDGDVPLYTAPPQREWQGLTEAERVDILDAELTTQNTEHFALAQAIEAKLKEKNSG